MVSACGPSTHATIEVRRPRGVQACDPLTVLVGPAAGPLGGVFAVDVSERGTIDLETYVDGVRQTPSPDFVHPDAALDVVGGNAEFGRTLACGDATGDGVSDLVVGGASVSGAALFAGPIGPVEESERPRQDGAVLAGDGDEEVVVALEDVDGDGVMDLLLGRPGPRPGSDGDGEIAVFLGPIEREARLAFDDADLRLVGEEESDFGSVLDASTDLDGDGLHEIVVGGPDVSVVRLTAGQSGGLESELACHILAPSAEGTFAASLATVPGLLPGNLPGLVIGDPSASRVYIHSLEGDCPLFSILEGADGSGVGADVASLVVPAGSLLLVGAPQHGVAALYRTQPSPAERVGRVFTLTAPLKEDTDMSAAREFVPPAGSHSYGEAVVATADVLNDGLPEVLVTAFQSGQVFVYDGGAFTVGSGL